MESIVLWKTLTSIPNAYSFIFQVILCQEQKTRNVEVPNIAEAQQRFFMPQVFLARPRKLSYSPPIRIQAKISVLNIKQRQLPIAHPLTVSLTNQNPEVTSGVFKMSTIKMGRIFLDHIGGTRLFSCANCDTILTNRSELISTRFTGATGRAFLFNKVCGKISFIS